MRNLQTGDLFNAIRLIKKLELKEDLKHLKIDEKNMYSAGFDILFLILEKATEKDIEEAVYKFLAGPFDTTINEIKVMDPIDLINGILEIASIDKWKVFLKQVTQQI